MAYYLNLFSPDTYETFKTSGMKVSGFRVRQRNQAEKIEPGDKFICYLTKLSRWIGVLEITSPCFEDESPLYYDVDDPYVVRFQVKPLVFLEKEHTLPIREDKVWQNLSFTKGQDKNSSRWTGRLRSSLSVINDKDGRMLENILRQQETNNETYPVNEQEYLKLATHKVRTLDKVVSVSVPEDFKEEDIVKDVSDVRESIKIQTLLAQIGAAMGMKIWIPKADRGPVFEEWKSDDRPVLDILPLNYDHPTLKTIEQIDVLWLRGRSIIRAFEVEHTTSIYSGLLRMADLLALQPNMDIKLHIVAPDNRRDKVLQEIQRPVFSLLERRPLSEICTYISYDSLRELSKQKHLSHFSDSVLDEYAEQADE